MSTQKKAEFDVNATLRDILSGSKELESMSVEDLQKMRASLNVYKARKVDKPQFVNMTIINWVERYLRNLYLTAMTGYMFRNARDYEPKQELEDMDMAYRKRIDETIGAEPEVYAKMREEHDKQCAQVRLTASKYIRNFLATQFEFDPDAHVRNSHVGVPEDKKRPQMAENIAKTCATAAKAASVSQKLESNSAKAFTRLKEAYSMLSNHIAEAHTQITAAEDVLRRNMDPETQLAILTKRRVALGNMRNNIKEITEPLTCADTLDAWTHDPPADTLFHFRRYIDNNFEKLREACETFFKDRADVEFSIIVRGIFDSEEDAKNQISSTSGYDSSVVTVEVGPACLLGPYAENTKAAQYLSKETKILEEMTEAARKDQELGADMVNKRIDINKSRNTRIDGPNAPEFARYMETVNTISQIGSKTTPLTAEEKATLEKAREVKADLEVPDDAIQTKVFSMNVNDDGTQTFSERVMYTASERPEHMRPGSKYANEYQPIPDICLQQQDEAISEAASGFAEAPASPAITVTEDASAEPRKLTLV